MDDFAIYPSLEGRVALVTGGGSGIGAAHVKELTAQGVKVGFIDNDVAVSMTLADEIAAAGQERPILSRPTFATFPRSSTPSTGSLPMSDRSTFSSTMPPMTSATTSRTSPSSTSTSGSR